MLGGSTLGLTIHFDKAAPDAIEQWLSTEARYIIGSFGKHSDLERVYGARTDAVIAECKKVNENVVNSISMILDSDLKKLNLTVVRLQNGDTFLLDEKYKLVENAETRKLVDKLLGEDSPRVFSVTNR
jgi:hypothetical protein